MRETAGVRSRPITLAPVVSLLPYVLWPLLVTGLGELVLFRTLSRAGVHIPKDGAVLEVYEALVRLGSYSFNLASVAVVVALALVSIAALRGEFGDRPHLGALAPVLLAFAAASVFLAFVEDTSTTKLLYGLLSACIMTMLAGQAWKERRQRGVRSAVVVIAVLAYLAAQYRVLGAEALQASPPGGFGALEAGEALVLVNCGVIFWGWSGVRFRRGAWLSPLQAGVAGLLVVLFLGSYYGRPDSSTAAILSLWSLGLTLYLPVPLYMLALALYGATVARCLSGGPRGGRALSWDAVALGLLPVAGLSLDLTYQHLVAVLALALLVARPRPGNDL